MKLWTPPHTIESPRCPVCGLPRISAREPIAVRDRRRWSHHRLCCCGCPDNVEITLNGVDAAICTNCQASGGDANQKTTSITIDGTYTIPYIGTASGKCLYRSNSVLGTDISGDRYTFDPTCTPPPVGTFSGTIRIQVYVTSTAPHNIVEIDCDNFVSAPSTPATAFYYIDATGVAFGTSINNEKLCSWEATPRFGGSNGGTAVVVRA